MSQHLSTVGVIATVPRIFKPSGGTEFCTFRLASTERRFDGMKQEWVDGTTNWFTVNMFRTLAVHAHQSLSKGDRVIVAGRIRVRNWEKDSKRGTNVEIDADGIGHDLRWGTTRFTKRGAMGVDAPEVEQPSPIESGSGLNSSGTESTIPRASHHADSSAPFNSSAASEEYSAVSEEVPTPF